MNAAAKPFDGNNKYIRITDINESSSEYSYNDVVSPDAILQDFYLVKDNDILLARTGASTGKSYLYKSKDGCLYFAGFLIRINIPNDNPYFIFSQLHTTNYRKWITIMSARSGQPGINSQEYSSYPLYLTNKEEQSKISTLLSKFDERIATQNKIIDRLESLIKGLCLNLQLIGLKDNTWQKVYLTEVLTERKEKNKDNYEVHSVSVSHGIVNQIGYLGRSFAAEDTSNYHVVKNGDIVYTKSPTGEFPYGIVKQSMIIENVAVSPLYGVYMPENKYIGTILHYYFMNCNNTNNYLHPLIQKGAKNTINITNQHFLDNTVILPNNTEEIKNVASLLSSIQYKIATNNKLLNNYKKQKQYLLQHMFI